MKRLPSMRLLVRRSPLTKAQAKAKGEPLTTGLNDAAVETPNAVAKADRERRVFEEFVRKSGLPIDVATIESREPPEPDIRCFHSHDGPIHGFGRRPRRALK